VARCNEPSYFNTDIYTVADAARLTRVSKGRIRPLDTLVSRAASATV